MYLHTTTIIHYIIIMVFIPRFGILSEISLRGPCKPVPVEGRNGLHGRNRSSIFSIGRAQASGEEAIATEEDCCPIFKSRERSKPRSPLLPPRLELANWFS